MNRAKSFFWLLTLIFLLGLTAAAEVEIKPFGQIRVRAEISDRSFHPDSTTRQYNLMRTRLGVSAVLSDNSSAYIQFQDSRTFGQYTTGGKVSSGTTNDGNNADLHQAYIKVKHLWKECIGLKAGRFEFNLGNQRVFGAVGWHNVGRSWDGLQLNLNRDQFSVTGFWLKGLERNFSDYAGDFDIAGAQVSINEYGFDVFGFYEYDGYQPDTTIMTDTGAYFVSTKVKTLQRFNLGAFGSWNYEDFDFAANGVIQTGKQIHWSLAANSLSLMADEYDISALMFTFEAGYSFKGNMKARLAGAIDYTSGDDNSDDKVEHYNNMYYTGHKFRGYMDYFLKSEKSGLVDIIFRGKFVPIDGWVVKGDLHLFSRATEYVDYKAEKTTDVGSEIDLTASTKNISGVKLDIGASIFFPSESFAKMDNPETTYWFYTQLTAGF